MSPSSFENEKDLKFTITLNNGSSFGVSGQNVLTLQGLRATVDIDRAGGAAYGHMHAQVFGVSQADMNAATSYKYQIDSIPRNSISVWAIDGDSQTLVFSGDVVTCWANYQNQPEVFLQIEAVAGYYALMTPVSPTSYATSFDVATAMQSLATQMGFTFENSSNPPVTVQLPTMYLSGTAMQQAQQIVDAAGIAMYLDNGILAITPLYQPRATSTVPEISAQSGMVGYPTYDGRSVNFSMLFNPAVKYGGVISVVTDNPPGAAGQWYVASIAHSLSSQKLGGPFFSRVSGLKINLVGNTPAATG
jgi:hypothetical protein